MSFFQHFFQTYFDTKFLVLETCDLRNISSKDQLSFFDATLSVLFSQYFEEQFMEIENEIQNEIQMKQIEERTLNLQIQTQNRFTDLDVINMLNFF